jgi:hypothetical protein
MATVRAILVIWIFGLGWFSSAETANTNTYKLAFFLVRNAPESALLGKAFDRSAIKLSDKPLLADTDFVSYNTNDHYFSVTADAARLMAKQLSSNNPRVLPNGASALVLEVNTLGEPFAVVVGGEIVYIGTLSNPAVDEHYLVPTIHLFELVPPESKVPVMLGIRAAKAKPDPPLINGPKLKHLRDSSKDVRSDSRVMSALKQLRLIR